MFERFTRQAREAVTRAQAEARHLGHDYIGAEHLLLGVLSQPEAPGVAALNRLGIEPERFRGETVRVLTSSPNLGPSDADALQTLGIDLDEVKRRVEASFGPDALTRPLGAGASRRRWLPWRRRRCLAPVGHIPFTPRAKRAMKRALREALSRGDKHIGSEHVLLALLADEENLAAGVLRLLGVDPGTARRDVLAELGRAA